MATEDDDARAKLLRPRTDERHPMVAAWITVVLTGAGHVYAGERARGLVLLGSEIVALGAISERWGRIAATIWTVFLAFAVLDAVGAETPARPVRGVIWAFPAIAAVSVAARSLL